MIFPKHSLSLILFLAMALIVSCSDEDTVNGAANRTPDSFQFTLAVWDEGADQKSTLVTQVSYPKNNGGIETATLTPSLGNITIESRPCGDLPKTFEITIEQSLINNIMKKETYRLGLGVSLKVTCIDSEGHTTRTESFYERPDYLFTAEQVTKVYPKKTVLKVSVSKQGDITIE